MLRYEVLSAILVLGLASGAASGADTNSAWRLAKAIDLPGWLSLDGTYRARYESLDGPFRPKARGSDQIMVERLWVNARVTVDRLYADVELEDSRQQLADSGTPLGTDIVNTLEPLQAYLGARFSDVFSASDRLDLTAGRMTIDVGSRRLVARNRFRNTANAFTGVRAAWQRSDGYEAQAFYVLPVQRRPSDFASLKDNDSEIDTETSGAQFWGIFGAKSNILGTATGEAYFYGLRTSDRPDIPVADRKLYAPGVRLFVRPASKSWDYEVEGAFQFGTSRLTTAAADKKNLQHRAGFFHGAAGYTLPANMSPRLELSYDYASGDRDPKDGTNNRFDTLYGARRFDFGPTGIYGALARSNISSPGMRIEAKPTRDVRGFAGYRAVWLASSKDQFTTARLQDPTGRSGSFVGHQIEAQLQYNVLPGNLALEIGGAYLIHGKFLENAPNAPHEGNTTYYYASVTATF
jgi:hypothetical protein